MRLTLIIGAGPHDCLIQIIPLCPIEGTFSGCCADYRAPGMHATNANMKRTSRIKGPPYASVKTPVAPPKMGTSHIKESKSARA